MHNEICASCKMRKRGPSGMPIFCNRSSPKYGSSIIPTRCASNKSAYFWNMTNEIKQMVKMIVFLAKMLQMNRNAFYSLHSLDFLEIIALTADHRQKNWSTFSLASDSSDSVVPAALYYSLTLYCGANFGNGPLVLGYFNRMNGF